MPVPPEAVVEAQNEGAPRILMVSHYFEDHRGGIEIVAGRLARELAALGMRVSWAATGAPPQLDPAWRTVPLAAWNGTERALGVPLPLPSPAAAERLADACAEADAIVVHDALYPSSVIARFAGRRSRKPVMIVQHIGAIDYRNPLLRLLMRLANALVARPMLRGADQVVFISETTRAHFGLPARAAAETIFNGVDVDRFRPPADAAGRAQERAALGLAADGPLALFVGRFVEKKGLHWLRGLAEAHPEIHWALAGWGPVDPGGWGLANVTCFSDLSGDALAGLYRAADLFVLPSIGEGFPLVVQEALASGLPVLCGSETAAADPAAMPFLAGVRIDADRPAETLAALDAALARLLREPNDPAARHAFARDHYSWPAAARRYRSLIEAMIAHG